MGSSEAKNELQIFTFVIKLIATIILWGAFIWGVWSSAQDGWKFLLVYIGDSNTLFSAKNLTSLGLIFQFIGIFVVLPELVKRESADRWERWFHQISQESQKVSFSIKDLFLVSPETIIQTDGVIGFVNLICRGLNFYIIAIYVTPSGFANIFFADNEFMRIYFMVVLTIWFYGWLLMTIYFLRNKLLGVDFSCIFTAIYGILNVLMIGGWITFFILISLPMIIILRVLRRIAEYSIEKILAQATFPFILVGTGLELIASFMQ